MNAEFKQRWPALIVAFVGMGLCMPTIPLFGWGLFMQPLSQAFGWSLGHTSSGLAAFTISLGLAAFPGGFLIDRFGPYRILAISMPLSCLAFAGLAATDASTLRYYILWIIVGIAGVGSGPIVWTRLLAEQFHTSRGLALGIASCGAAAFLLIVKPVVQLVIGLAGWQVGLVFLGLLPLLLLYPAALLVMRPRPNIDAEVITAAPAMPLTGFKLHEIFGQWRFYIMILSALGAAAVPGILPHLEGALQSQGISSSDASMMTALMGIALLIGRLGAGYYSDKFWSPGMFAAFLVLSGVSAFCLTQSHEWTLLLLCVLGIGAASGGEFQLLAYITARYFGVRSYEATFGLLYGLTTGLGGLWSLAIGRMVDTTGSYATPFGFVLIALAVNAGVLMFMGRAPTWAGKSS